MTNWSPSAVTAPAKSLSAGRARSFCAASATRPLDGRWPGCTSTAPYARYVPDANPHLRWLEDEYAVPSAALAGKSAVQILIQPVACAGTVSFNQFGIKVYGVN